MCKYTKYANRGRGLAVFFKIDFQLFNLIFAGLVP